MIKLGIAGRIYLFKKQKKKSKEILLRTWKLVQKLSPPPIFTVSSRSPPRRRINLFTSRTCSWSEYQERSRVKTSRVRLSSIEGGKKEVWSLFLNLAEENILEWIDPIVPIGLEKLNHRFNKCHWLTVSVTIHSFDKTLFCKIFSLLRDSRLSPRLNGTKTKGSRSNGGKHQFALTEARRVALDQGNRIVRWPLSTLYTSRWCTEGFKRFGRFK